MLIRSTSHHYCLALYTHLAQLVGHGGLWGMLAGSRHPRPSLQLIAACCRADREASDQASFLASQCIHGVSSVTYLEAMKYSAVERGRRIIPCACSMLGLG
ncbi:hypothetical protein GQ55_1G404400 [Panicum hallii var. hallii]|uniref:Uncharacterized protein n=1 Tax=Panicum hallii var. hallii TaxID=1504633 RepID=A0A2T7FCN5_9POAL|nr:hypothetical protein GQ55_1G404400 [Panicum hallii var. hallii]